MAVLDEILNYVKNNSIDFVAMIASFFIALETDRYLCWRKDRNDKKAISEAIIDELTILQRVLNEQIEQAKKDMTHGTVFLRVSPYSYPYWSSLKNTDRIDLFSVNTGYKETLAFYSELELLNQWENVQTEYILFAQEKRTEYTDALIHLVSTQRTKCLDRLNKALEKLKEER